MQPLPSLILPLVLCDPNICLALTVPGLSQQQHPQAGYLQGPYTARTKPWMALTGSELGTLASAPECEGTRAGAGVGTSLEGLWSYRVAHPHGPSRMDMEQECLSNSRLEVKRSPVGWAPGTGGRVESGAMWTNPCAWCAGGQGARAFVIAHICMPGAFYPSSRLHCQWLGM